jgi:hypothetical protein
VAKSLIAADIRDAAVHYRLLDTTHAYGFGKLKEAGESGLIAPRHAVYFRNLFQRAKTEWQTRPTAQWRKAYIRKIDDVRPALDWAFSPMRDVSIGVALRLQQSTCGSKCIRVRTTSFAQPVSGLSGLSAAEVAMRCGVDVILIEKGVFGHEAASALNAGQFLHEEEAHQPRPDHGEPLDDCLP